MTLEEWLDCLRSGKHPKNFIDYQFLSDQHRRDFLEIISTYPESDIELLLDHFLLHSVSLGQDTITLKSLERSRNGHSDSNLDSDRMKHTFFQRLIGYSYSMRTEPPWQGVSWVIDLLPWWPGEAISVLNAYLLAHGIIMPDGRINGLSDALAIIRARYIGVPGSQKECEDFLTKMEPRDFEHLVNELYSKLNYSCKLTPRGSDGGRDIVAKRDVPSKREQLLIECKRYTRPVGVAVVRHLLGVVSHERANKGVVVTSAGFTRGAIDFAEHDPRIELISGEELVLLLNENLGPDWPSRVDSHILKSKRRSERAA